jgi:hypothetical protein
MLQSGNRCAQSLIAVGGFVDDGERTASRERNSDNDSYYGSGSLQPPSGPKPPIINA